MNFSLISAKQSASYFLPEITSTNSFLSEVALMASLAPFLTMKEWLSPKASSQAWQRMLDMLAFWSLNPSKVVLMKVSSHIILSKFLPVESYVLYYLGALSSLLFPVLYMTMLSSISILTKLKNPWCPWNLWLFYLKTRTLSLTSEKAMPKKVLIFLNALQNSSNIAKKSSNTISLISLYFSSTFSVNMIVLLTSKFSSSFLSFSIPEYQQNMNQLNSLNNKSYQKYRKLIQIINAINRLNYRIFEASSIFLDSKVTLNPEDEFFDGDYGTSIQIRNLVYFGIFCSCVLWRPQS